MRGAYSLCRCSPSLPPLTLNAAIPGREDLPRWQAVSRVAAMYVGHQHHLLDMQDLKHRVRYPLCFAHKYKDIVQNGHQYIMESWSNMIWLGCLIAEYGPPGFQLLWKHLQPALKHYIYGLEDTQPDQMRVAANSLYAYADSRWNGT